MLLRITETIFHSQYFWFYCFGAMILLYIIAAIYNRKKHPKQGIKSIKVKVDSINQARVQLETRTNGLLWTPTPGVPGARFDVAFLDEEHNETICLKVNEQECEKLKVGESGILQYNGDEYISFLQGQEAEAASKKELLYLKLVRYKRIAIVSILGLVVLIGGIYYIWNNNQEEEAAIETGEKPLSIYLVGKNAYVDGELSDNVYQTLYLLGEFTPTASKSGQEGYIFNQAINGYVKKLDRDVKITQFDNTRIMLETAYNDWQKGEGPDVIIGEYTQSGYCLYPYMNQGMFADLMPYFEMDEIYSGGEYVSQVLKAGTVNNAQLVFPLTFNMNVLYTSEERQTKHEKWLSNDMTYSELMKLFTEGWQEYGKNEEYLLLQFTNMFPNDYPYLLFQASSGECPIDYNTGKITLSKESFKEWAKLYESFICDDFDMDREELKRLAQQNQGMIPYELSEVNNLILTANGGNILDLFEVCCNDALCIGEGGNSSYQLHSFAANTAYYESRFTDAEEQFECVGIPTKSNAEGYAAQVTTFGAVLSDSEKVKEGYELLKMLADTETWMHLDISVNRKIAGETLNDLAATTYEFYPGLGLKDPSTEMDDYGESYQIKPMSKETKDYLLYMIDHIETANLPEYGLNTIVTQEIEEYLWGETDTVDEAYDNAVARLEELGYQK